MKLYVLIRKDILSPSQQAVQGGHAVAEFLLNSNKWRNSTLIYLEIKSERQLNNWLDKLEFSDIEYYIWREPDLNNQITSIAAYSNENFFKRLNLL